MLDQLHAYAVQHQTLSAILVSALVLVVAYFPALPREHAPSILVDVPLVDISQVKKRAGRARWFAKYAFDQILQYRGQLWQLKARHGTIVVLPERFISELCYLPEEFVSLEAKNTGCT